MTNFTAMYDPDPLICPSSLAHFSSIPCTRTLLSLPDYTPTITPSRIPKPETGEDYFWSITLASPTTIPHCLSLRRRTLLPPLTSTNELHSSSAEEPDLITLLHLSTPGLSGHPSTAHGGAVTTILDEIMSLVPGLREPDVREAIYTVQLNTTFKRAVRVPGTVVVRAWCTQREGRKCWVKGEVLQDDGSGEKEGVEVMAASEGLWVVTKPKL